MISSCDSHTSKSYLTLITVYVYVKRKARREVAERLSRRLWELRVRGIVDLAPLCLLDRFPSAARVRRQTSVTDTHYCFFCPKRLPHFLTR